MRARIVGAVLLIVALVLLPVLSLLRRTGWIPEGWSRHGRSWRRNIAVICPTLTGRTGVNCRSSRSGGRARPLFFSPGLGKCQPPGPAHHPGGGKCINWQPASFFFQSGSGSGWQGSGLHGTVFSIYVLIQLGGGPGPGQCAGYDRYGFGLGPGVIASAGCLGQHYGSGNLPAFLLTTAAVVGNVVDNIILPLLFAASALAAVNQMLAGVDIDKLAGLLKDISVWLLGFLVTGICG